MSRCFFHFLKIWFSGSLGGQKGKKWSKMIKILSVVLYISGTIHHMIVIYGILFKFFVSIVFFFFFFFFHFFKNLIFRVVRGVKGQRNRPKWQTLCHAPYLRNHKSYDCHLWCTCVKWYLQAWFSFLQNFDSLGC